MPASQLCAGVPSPHVTLQPAPAHFTEQSPEQRTVQVDVFEQSMVDASPALTEHWRLFEQS